jgi:hypothetical protein
VKSLICLFILTTIPSPDITCSFNVTFTLPGAQPSNTGVNLSSNPKLFPVSPNNQQTQQQQQQPQIQGNRLYGREGEGPGYSGGSNSNNLQWQNYQQQQMSPAATYQGPLNLMKSGNNHEYEGE